MDGDLDHRCPQAFHGHQANLINLLAVMDDVNLLDGRGRTALHLAAARGNLPCLQSLLEQKVGPALIGPDRTSPELT